MHTAISVRPTDVAMCVEAGQARRYHLKVADIFISYVHQDRAVAERLAEALRTHGWSVWWDRTLLPGQTFGEVIETELSAANAVVVLWSANSIRSDWVRDEAQQAQSRKILVPCLVDSITPPLGFRQAQCADLTGWMGDLADARFVSLRKGLTRLSRPGEPPRPLWMRQANFAARWNDAPDGSTLSVTAFVYQNRDAVAISVDVQCAEGKWLAHWTSGDLVTHEQRLSLAGYPFYKVAVALSSFAKSDITVVLRLFKPDGMPHDEPVHLRSSLVPNTEYSDIAIYVGEAEGRVG